ncbi:hypothetical protein AYO47_04700 [Planctomyces sp. SCGC AG-212-M04]|nr:hypothetical protein AYO47_04700 [Planctomyces sp. SCGC AG-212-M04]
MGADQIAWRLFRRLHGVQLLGVTWAALAAVYWWHFVPALPQAVIPIPDDRNLAGFTAEGDLVTARVQYEGKRSWFLTGPIEVISARDGHVLKALYEPKDFLVAAPEGGSHIAMRRGDDVLVSHLTTEHVALRLPVPSARATASFSVDDRKVAVAAGNAVSLHVIATGEQIWRREFQLEELTGAELGLGQPPVVEMEFANIHGDMSRPGTVLGVSWTTVEPEEPRIKDSGGELWLSTATGERDPRIEDNESVIESHDGRYGIVEYFPKRSEPGQQSSEYRIDSLTENRTLWYLPPGSLAPEFGDDPEEVWLYFAIDGRPFLSRQRTRDGSLISAVRPGEEGGPTALVDPTTQWLVAEVHHEPILAPTPLVAAVKKLGISWDGLIKPAGRHIVRTDLDGSHSVLLIPQIYYEASFYRPWLRSLGRHGHFAVVSSDQAAIYSFQPQRDWQWLVLWAGSPLVTFLAIHAAWRRSITRQPPAPASPALDTAG